MLRSRFLNLTIFSSFLHIAFFSLVSPVFYSTRKDVPIYSWGNYDEVSLLTRQGSTPPYFFTGKVNVEDFLLPFEKSFVVDFEKNSAHAIIFKKRPQVKIIAISKQVAPPVLIYSHRLILGADIEFVNIKHKIPLTSPFAKKRIVVRALISPTGRAMWIEDYNFLNDIKLRFDLDDWLRTLNFPPAEDYDWKTIQIMLK